MPKNLQQAERFRGSAWRPSERHAKKLGWGHAARSEVNCQVTLMAGQLSGGPKPAYFSQLSWTKWCLLVLTWFTQESGLKLGWKVSQLHSWDPNRPNEGEKMIFYEAVKSGYETMMEVGRKKGHLKLRQRFMFSFLKVKWTVGLIETHCNIFIKLKVFSGSWASYYWWNLRTTICFDQSRPVLLEVSSQ